MKQQALAVLPRRGLTDRFGIFLAAVCIVHCTALPVAIVALPVLAQFMPESHWIDLPLIALSAPLCLLAMLQGWRLHGSRLPSALAVPGVVLLLLSVTIGHQYGIEEILVLSGASLIGIAHLLNLSGSRHCERGCTDDSTRS